MSNTMLSNTTMIWLLCCMLYLPAFLYAQPGEQSNGRLVGGPCEGCEAIFEYGESNLSPIDTLPGFDEGGLRIKITGTIYLNDGVTPAEGIILYVYHTNQKGEYTKKGDEKGWAKRHGYIRGWIKTGKDGKYTFYTLKPGRYPGRSISAHIHPTILEPDGKYYWLGAYHFTGDPFLSKKEISQNAPRGGSVGLLDLVEEGNIWVGRRDFTLGKNIPGYE